MRSASTASAGQAWISLLGMLIVIAVGYWLWQKQAAVEPQGEEVAMEQSLSNGGRTRTAANDAEASSQSTGGQTTSGNEELKQVNQLGLQAMKEERYSDAVEHFRQAIELSPNDPVLPINLARALSAEALRLMNAGYVRQAESLLQEAVQTDLDQGYSQSRLAQAWLRLGRRQQAAHLVEGVRQQFPNCVPAWKTSAEIAFADGELNDAVSAMEKVAELLPEDQAMQQRLSFFRREQQMLASFLRVRSTRFDCMYDANNAAIQPHLQQLLLDLEAASDAVNAQLGLQPLDRLLVLLLSPDDYRSGAPNWSNGLYDGRIRVPFDGSSPPNEGLRATFRHEYTHAALHRVGPSIATWLHEGLAQWVEGGSGSAAADYLRSQAKPLPTLGQLQGNWTQISSAAQVRGYYAYALSLTSWLSKQYGDASLAQLVQAMQHQGQEEAFVATFGMDTAELDRRHRQQL